MIIIDGAVTCCCCAIFVFKNSFAAHIDKIIEDLYNIINTRKHRYYLQGEQQMKIVEILKAGKWDLCCICCGGTRTYPDGRAYPVRVVNIRYYGSKCGTGLTLCSACANDLANELRAIDYTEENTDG